MFRIDAELSKKADDTIATSPVSVRILAVDLELRWDSLSAQNAEGGLLSELAGRFLMPWLACARSFTGSRRFF